MDLNEARLAMALSYIAVLSIDAVFKGKVAYEHVRMKRATGRHAFIEELFEIASWAEVGDKTMAEEVDELLRAMPDATPICNLSIVDFETATYPASEVIAKRMSAWSDTVLLPAVDGSWVYWRPVGFPQSTSRLLQLPKRRDAIVDYRTTKQFF